MADWPQACLHDSVWAMHPVPVPADGARGVEGGAGGHHDPVGQGLFRSEN